LGRWGPVQIDGRGRHDFPGGEEQRLSKKKTEGKRERKGKKKTWVTNKIRTQGRANSKRRLLKRIKKYEVFGNENLRGVHRKRRRKQGALNRKKKWAPPEQQ